MTLNEFIEKFNLSGQVSLTDTEFNELKEIALFRFSLSLGYDYPQTPTPLEKEILGHFILIEVLKKYQYLFSENSQKVSIKKATENLERLIWQQKTLRTRTN